MESSKSTRAKITNKSESCPSNNLMQNILDRRERQEAIDKSQVHLK